MIHCPIFLNYSTSARIDYLNGLDAQAELIDDNALPGFYRQESINLARSNDPDLEWKNSFIRALMDLHAKVQSDGMGEVIYEYSPVNQYLDVVESNFKGDFLVGYPGMSGLIENGLDPQSVHLDYLRKLDEEIESTALLNPQFDKHEILTYLCLRTELKDQLTLEEFNKVEVSRRINNNDIFTGPVENLISYLDSRAIISNPAEVTKLKLKGVELLNKLNVSRPESMTSERNCVDDLTRLLTLSGDKPINSFFEPQLNALARNLYRKFIEPNSEDSASLTG